MTIQVYIALIAWPLVTAAMFAQLGARQGLCYSCVFGYLFLPSAGFVIADGLPPCNKDMVISTSCLLAAVIFAPAPLARFRPQWFDLLPLVAMIGWGVSSLVNGLGIQDALLMWWWYAMFAGCTYLLGRCYLVGIEAIRELSTALVVSVLVYACLAVIEMRLSPQFNNWVYGFQTFAFWETKRDLSVGGLVLGGYRPRVFLPTGLALAIWLASGTVVAWALWLGGLRFKVMKITLPVVAVFLTVVTVLCRGTGAFALMFAAIITLLASKWLRWKLAMLWIPAFVALYLATALLGPFVPIREPMVNLSRQLFGDTRAGSLEFRFQHEDALVDKALQSPIFGWGGWNRNRVDLDVAKEVLGKASVTDGFWIIVLGQRGLVGLIGTWGWMLIPATLAVLWATRIDVPTPLLYLILGLSAWSTLFALDQLLNGFNNPVQALVAGALGSFVSIAKRHRTRPSPSRGLATRGQRHDQARPTAERPRSLSPISGASTSHLEPS